MVLAESHCAVVFQIDLSEMSDNSSKPHSNSWLTMNKNKNLLDFQQRKYLTTAVHPEPTNVMKARNSWCWAHLPIILILKEIKKKSEPIRQKSGDETAHKTKYNTETFSPSSCSDFVFNSSAS